MICNVLSLVVVCTIIIYLSSNLIKLMYPICKTITQWLLATLVQVGKVTLNHVFILLLLETTILAGHNTNNVLGHNLLSPAFVLLMTLVIYINSFLKTVFTCYLLFAAE